MKYFVYLYIYSNIYLAEATTCGLYHPTCPVSIWSLGAQETTETTKGLLITFASWQRAWKEPVSQSLPKYSMISGGCIILNNQRTILTPDIYLMPPSDLQDLSRVKCSYEPCSTLLLPQQPQLPPAFQPLQIQEVVLLFAA